MAQVRYKKAFDSRMRNQKDHILVDDYVFTRRDYTATGDGTTPKLAAIADWPYKVRGVTDDTCVIYRGDETERLSLDRVVLAPLEASATPRPDALSGTH